MRLVFSNKDWDDYLFWQRTDKQNLKKINQLIKDIQRKSFEGIGKSKPLKYELSGFWSRRITDEHRLVYEVCDNEMAIVSCRYHY